MESENALALEFIREYGDDVMALAEYIPYFMSKAKGDFSKKYDGKYGESSLNFPVYDSTLLAFIKKAGQSKLIDRNYPYIYTRYRIKDHEDERNFIARATIRDVKILKGFFSKYVIEGNRIAKRWSEGADERIYLGVLEKMKGFIEFYSLGSK
ncbi:MAG: hypothetical protein K5894_09415 [Lachnospiraceae bacterium]|nr:hypothetical protein [Lachnospiraceae bacterium]MDN4742297.1 hypothetical protein [Lachnospiraceae bacterium C1.1]